MSDEEQTFPATPAPAGEPPVQPPGEERFRDLAELQEEIRRRLRSNQRFLEKFLDEDFIDDEDSGEEEQAEEDEL